MNEALDVIEGDVLINDGRIATIGDAGSARADRTINVAGNYLLPGFVHTHLHLCQTLFRGYADDLALLDWLKRRIWPMEAAHTAASLRASARLATAELLLAGTTTALTMETVHDTDAVFDALEPMGMRAVIGKCMMDSDQAVPKRLLEDTRASIDASLALAAKWNDRTNGRLRAAFAPRFALSCSRELLEEVARLSESRNLLVHTHASENRDEIALVWERTGRRNVEYFDDVRLASPRLCLAHCVWIDEAEQRLLAERQVKVSHCPASNLKLGSGVAPVVEMRAKGISVSLGSDGAACNNHLDMFAEMRLAATLQAMRRAPGALPAREVLTMATREGARALGLEQQIGSIEVGKHADLTIVDRNHPHLATNPDPFSALVYAARPSDVRTTIVGGDVLVDDFRLVREDLEQIVADGRREARALASRASLA
jgi:5-methylthioadenosine/S-adenosylhomocysteine deaminase